MRLKTTLILLCSFKLFSSLPLFDDFLKGHTVALVYEKPMVVAYNLQNIFLSEKFSSHFDKEFIFINDKSEDSSLSFVILYDKDGDEITKMGYDGTSIEKFAEEILARFELYQKIKFSISSENREDNLVEMYKTTLEYGFKSLKEKIMEKGVLLSTGVFFQVEKYAFLVTLGQKESEEAKLIRKTIMERDPKNLKGSRLRLALIDFQEGDTNSAKSVEPLQAYIKEFGKSDLESLPKIHALIANF